MRTVMIVDPEQNYAASFQNAFQDQFDIHICREFDDPASHILDCKPDYLILNFATSLYDGFSLLRTLQGQGVRPVVLGIIHRSNVYTNWMLDELNVAAALSFPFSPKVLLSTFGNVASVPMERLVPLPTRTQFVSDMLASLGINTKSLGGKALIQVIPMYADDQTLCFTKDLYPAVGKPTGHTKEQVERNIRSAIEGGCAQQEQYPWRDYFPTEEDGKVKRPKCSDFIKLFAKILLSQKGQYRDEEV